MYDKIVMRHYRITLINMVENLILQQALLSQQDIDEIHKVFVLMDPDGTGQITVSAIRQMAVYVTKDPNISDDEASTLSVYLDTNKDGKVTWHDFLDATCKWLHERSFVRHRQRTDLPSTISEKEALHKGIAELFAMNRVCFEIFQSPSDSLENRVETWDYFGEGKVYNDNEKQAYYQTVYAKIQDQALFQRLSEQIALTDIDAVYQGLCEIRELLGVMTLFPSSNERYSISPYLEYVFNHLVANPSIMARVLQCLGADSISRLQWEALKIITLFVPGPRIPALPVTHYLHPSQHLTKDIVIKSGILPKLIELCESPCVEVKDQALLTIGFFARHDPEMRDAAIQNALMPGLLRLLIKGSNGLLQSSTTIKAAWTLSILCGATMPREFARPTVSTNELLEIADTLGTLLSNKTDENLLANCLNALSYVLPCLSLNDSTKLLIDRLIYLLGYESIPVKRAALQTTRNIIMLNPAQCQMLIDAKLYSRLNDILMNASASLVKLDACTVLRLLIRQGYTWEIMNSSQLFQQLQLLIDSDPELRWEAVRIINFVLDSRSPMAIENMARNGLIKTILNHLISFKEICSMITEIYGVSCTTYNFTYLYDCLKVLDKFLAEGWPTGDILMINIFSNYFGLEEAGRVFEIVKIIVEEVQKGSHDLYKLNHGEVNIEVAMNSLLEKFILVHKNMQSPYSEQLVQYLTNISNYFKCHLTSANFDLLVQNNINADAIINLNFKCMDATGYPNGVNRSIRCHSADELNYYNLKRRVTTIQISAEYGVDKNLFYLDSKGDKITLDSQDMLQYVVYTEVTKSFEALLQEYHSLNRQPPSPLYLKEVEIRLLVSNANIYLPQKLPIESQATNYYNKDQLFRELNALHGIDMRELERIYDEFRRVARHRGDYDAKVDMREFQEIMARLTNNNALIREIFNAIDTDKSGYIDFKNFIVGLSMLRHGTREQKLWLAFRAYDTMGLETLDRIQLNQLLRSAYQARNYSINETNILFQVNNILRMFDKDNDGKLTFEEFQAAVLSGSLPLNPFWTETTFENFNFTGFVDAISCSQCGSRFIPSKPTIGTLARCPTCTLSVPSPGKSPLLL